MNRKRIFSVIVAFLLAVTLIFGTQVNFASAQSSPSLNSSPIGTIAPYAGSVQGQVKGALENQGWLVCDGQAVPRINYPKLFQVIGNIYGDGDKTTTFNLPDLRGRFVRGVDDGTGRDPDALSRKASGSNENTGDSVGSVQEDMIQGHTHGDKGHKHSSWHFYGFQVDGNKGAEYTDAPELGGFRENYSPGKAQLGEPVKLEDEYGSVRYGQETRPKNIYVNWIIKAKN